MEAFLLLPNFAGGIITFDDLGDDDTICAMKHLEADGLVASAGLDEGHWVLTSNAVEQFVEHSLWLATPGRVFAPRANVSFDQYTQLELQLMMTEHGWTQRSLRDHQQEARQPFTGGDSPKTWYSDRNGRFFGNYLVCLLQSQKLFDAGLAKLFHGQIESYYTALLAGLDQASSGKGNQLLLAIEPWKPAT